MVDQVQLGFLLGLELIRVGNCFTAVCPLALTLLLQLKRVLGINQGEVEAISVTWHVTRHYANYLSV